MNTRDILNAKLYPRPGDNVRTKDYPIFDTQTITNGVTEYYYFVTALGNPFLRNQRLPLAGTEVYFVNAISASLSLKIQTLAQAAILNQLLQQSYLQISVDNRVQCKIPGLDFINYMFADSVTDQVPAAAFKNHLGGNVNKGSFLGRRLPLPIILNSTSSFEIKFVTTAAAATAFDTATLRLNLHGIQFDKLESFYWDNLKGNQFQEVPVTYYNTVPIPNGNEQTYELFANAAINQNLFSRVFPLSDIQTFQLQNLEVFVGQPDTPIEPSTIWFSRLQNRLRITIDDVDYYSGNQQETLSLFAGLGVTLTTTPNTDYINFLNLRQSKTFLTPLNIPANSKVRIALTQQAGSLGITGNITVAMRGVEIRRVA